jgi:nucleoside-diphosphate-sugar epimerase
MQTILGAGGSIGTELAKELVAFTKDIRLVSRNPKKVNETDQLFSADLTDAIQIEKSIEGSEVCYVTVGFEYKLSVWEKNWLPFINHVINACEKHRCRIVFFDNMYALNETALNPILEDAALNPSSKKGQVRANVNRAILKAIDEKRIEAIIARAPDFFGTEKIQNSMLMNLIYNNFKKNKSAQWLCSADMPHSMGYTPELAKGTAMLGNTIDTYNQIWNLPVCAIAPTGKEWATIFANEMNVKNKISTLPAWMLKILGIFIPVLGEMYEMKYQYDRPYIFDSSKFNKRFSYKPMSNEDAVKELLKKMK